MGQFERNVFINCPFDPDYRPLVLPLVFTVLYLGLRPRIAFERADSGELRLTKIVQLIRESKFSIHDLSRCRADNVGEYFRLNMPFELGIDAGFRFADKTKWKPKKFLVLEAHKYSYQKSISDLAGADMKCHKNQYPILIRIVRDWLVNEADAVPCSFTEIRGRFDDFTKENYLRLKAEGYSEKDIELLSTKEVTRAMEDWVATQRKLRNRS